MSLLAAVPPPGRGVIPWLILLVVCSLALGSTASASPPTIYLDAGGGRTAELTDYSFVPNSTDSGGTFCFTLTNTSVASPPQLPIYLVGVGIVLVSRTPQVSHSDLVAPEGFIIVPANIEGSDLSLDFMLAARNAPMQLEVYDGIDGPTDGIAMGSSGRFCLAFSSSQPLTLEGLIERIVLVFSDEVAGCYVPDIDIIDLPSVAVIHVDGFSAEEMSIRLTTYHPGALVQFPTGVAFDIPGDGGTYTLAAEPHPELGPMKFTTAPGRFRKAGGDFDFGLLIGNTRSDSGGFATFRVLGDFEGRSVGEILQRAVVRFGQEWVPLAPACPWVDPGGGAIRGAVATVAR